MCQWTRWGTCGRLKDVTRQLRKAEGCDAAPALQRMPTTCPANRLPPGPAWSWAHRLVGSGGEAVCLRQHVHILVLRLVRAAALPRCVRLQHHVSKHKGVGAELAPCGQRPARLHVVQYVAVLADGGRRQTQSTPEGRWVGGWMNGVLHGCTLCLQRGRVRQEATAAESARAPCVHAHAWSCAASPLPGILGQGRALPGTAGQRRAPHLPLADDVLHLGHVVDIDIFQAAVSCGFTIPTNLELADLQSRGHGSRGSGGRR